MLWTLTCTLILFAVVGCDCPQQLKDAKAANRLQRDRIAELENELAQCQTELQQKQMEMQGLSSRGGADLEAKNALISALEADIEKKKAIIAQLQAQILQGGATVLPPEMDMKLQDFAKSSDMIDYDSATGSLKFKSDLLFNLGDDTVTADAAAALKTLADIMNSAEGKQFDLVIAGHTDDVPIKRPATLAKHPTNWHLSVHRSIAVENILEKGGISPERMSVKGHGEYHPVEANKPGKKGSAANRRVEIFVVPGH